MKQHRDQHARNINIPTDRGILGDEAGLSHAAEVLGRTRDSAGYVQVVDFVMVFMMPVEISLHVLHVIPVDPFRTFRRKSHRNHVLCDDCMRGKGGEEKRE